MARLLPPFCFGVVLAACTASSSSPSPVPGAAGELTAPPDGCPGTRLRVYEEEPGVLERLGVDLPTPAGGRQFTIDTGSAHSFVMAEAASPGRPGAASVPTTIGCTPAELRTLAGFAGSTAPDGSPVTGVLGADLVSRGGILDFAIREHRFGWVFAPPSLPPGAITLPLTFTVSNDPFAKNMLVASGIELEGKPVRLVLDTGSPHVVVMSKTPRPDEVVEHTFDGNGNPVTLYISTITIAFPGAGTTAERQPRTVFVDRAESFPALEETLAAIGGGVSGILGLGALGHERIVIGKDQLSFVP